MASRKPTPRGPSRITRPSFLVVSCRGRRWNAGCLASVCARSPRAMCVAGIVPLPLRFLAFRRPCVPPHAAPYSRTLTRIRRCLRGLIYLFDPHLRPQATKCVCTRRDRPAHTSSLVALVLRPHSGQHWRGSLRLPAAPLTLFGVQAAETGPMLRLARASCQRARWRRRRQRFRLSRHRARPSRVDAHAVRRQVFSHRSL